MDPHQANQQLQLLFNFPFCFNPTSTFLGVTFDCTLFFPQMNLCLRPSSSLVSSPYAISLLPREALSKESIFLCKAFFWVVLSCASPGWFSFVSVTNITRLEHLHQASRITLSLFFPSFILLLCLFYVLLSSVFLSYTLWHILQGLSFPHLLSGYSGSPASPLFRGTTWVHCSNHPLCHVVFLSPVIATLFLD